MWARRGVDPLSNLLVAPVDDEVVDVQPSAHAVTIRSDEGLEILMHIGLDIVRLVGEGFTPIVKAGERVSAGDSLIEFDMDEVGRKAKSLLTKVVITNSDLVGSMTFATGVVVTGKDVAATVELAVRGEDDDEIVPGTAKSAVSGGSARAQPHRSARPPVSDVRGSGREVPLGHQIASRR